ncbi:MAG TPA: ComEA family DNA-binding protein [Gemmataceae bacterium]|nr:ComEA family DNA-binding protein [Gemmataceae bacterium]
MEAASSPVGVAAVSPAPPPQWSQAPRWVSPPDDFSVRLSSDPAPAWSRPAQAAAALFLLLALVLLGWHAWSAQRGRCRPAALETDALLSPSLELNQADHAHLLQLPGVGDNLARRIETYRVEHHGFRDVDELRQVPGISAKTLEKLRGFVYVEKARSDEEGDPQTEPARVVAKQVEKEKKPVFVPKKKAALTERIDVNHATSEELRRLPGIGPTLSQRIIEARAKQPFRKVEDLRRVRGIGVKTLERLRPYVWVGEKKL